MSTRLPLLTVLLVGVALAFAGLIAREITTVPRVAGPRPQPAASVAAATPAAPAAPGAAANYTVVASRNLFSPTRSEAPVTPPTPAPVTPVLPKPNLLGVVFTEGMPVAYLEDPVSKRVARYRVGDSVAGGTVKAIESDTVELLRTEGHVTVRLHDPTRPRPAAPAIGAIPGMPIGPVPVPGRPTQGIMPEGRPTSAIRRPPIPGVLGRVPPQPTDASSPR